MIVPLPSRTEPLAPVAQIKAVVAASYGISLLHMEGPSRNRKHAWPRQMAMYLARQLTDKSLPAIGGYFGHRDHTTVIHAIRAVEGRMARDARYRGDYEALLTALQSDAGNRGSVDSLESAMSNQLEKQAA